MKFCNLRRSKRMAFVAGFYDLDELFSRATDCTCKTQTYRGICHDHAATTCLEMRLYILPDIHCLLRCILLGASQKIHYICRLYFRFVSYNTGFSMPIKNFSNRIIIRLKLTTGSFSSRDAVFRGVIIFSNARRIIVAREK